MSESTVRPLISVLIATYNRAQSLCRAIESVLDHPGDYFELVIGDDGSPDNTAEAVRPYLTDPRVRYYRNAVNLGMRDNYLKIFREAQGDYIFILTDDDWMVKGGLERIAQVIREHPQVGYILSHLPTVDERTGKVVGIHRAFVTDRLVEPSLQNMANIAGHAWVLSRQVLRRDLIDWETWEKFKENIFFPIIFSGRVLLKAPYYYLADSIVMHTWFNKVFWHAFGKDQLEIDFNLSADRYRAMREILHDYEMTPEVRSVIERWELVNFNAYINAEQSGFYDLVRGMGFRSAMAKLRTGFNLTSREYVTLGAFLIQSPPRRAWVGAKSLVQRLAPTQFEKLKELKNRSMGRIE